MSTSCLSSTYVKLVRVKILYIFKASDAFFEDLVPARTAVLKLAAVESS